MQLLSYIDLTFRRWQRYGEVRRELATYTERELEDMGVRRGEIPNIARQAAALIQPASDHSPMTQDEQRHFANAAHS